MTYEETAALMSNGTFIGRVKVSCLHYANYIYNEAVTVPGHSSRVRWAQMTATSPDAVASTITPLVVMDDKVQTAGAEITDEDLQLAVENAVNKTV